MSCLKPYSNAPKIDCACLYDTNESDMLHAKQDSLVVNWCPLETNTIM